MALPSVCQAWGLGTDQPFAELVPETVWHLKTDHVVVKRRAVVSQRNRQKLQFEQQLRQQLSKTLPVTPAIPTIEGDYLASDQDHYFEAAPFVPADPLPTDDSRPATLRHVGAMIASLHLALADIPATSHPPGLRRNDLMHEILLIGIPKLKQFLTGQPLEAFSRLTATLEGPLADCYSSLDWQLIHRDCHAGNVLVRDGQVVEIIDWDQLSLGPAILDLAYYAVQLMKWHVGDAAFMQGWHSDWHQLQLGYDARRPMSEIERTCLKPMLLTIPLLFAHWCIDVGYEAYVGMELEALSWLHGNV